MYGAVWTRTVSSRLVIGVKRKRKADKIARIDKWLCVVCVCVLFLHPPQEEEKAKEVDPKMREH